MQITNMLSRTKTKSNIKSEVEDGDKITCKVRINCKLTITRTYII